MLNNLNSERIMEAREIYHVLKSIVEPIHAHDDQMVAIAKWIEAEFEYKPQKQANGVDQSAGNCNIPLVSNNEVEVCDICENDKGLETYTLCHSCWDVANHH